MAPTTTEEVVSPHVERGDVVSERGSHIISDRGLVDVVFQKLPDFTLVDVLMDQVHSRLGDTGSERHALEEYLSDHNIHAVGAKAIEELIDIRPICHSPESGKGAILTAKSTDEIRSDTYAVLKSPLFYGLGGIRADRVTLLAVIGDLKPGNKVYLVALQRNRGERYSYEEPALELSVYDISPHSDLGEYMQSGESRVKLEPYKPHGIDASYHCRDAVRAFEKEVALRKQEVAEHDIRRAAESLSEYIVVEEDSFHLKTAGFDTPLPLRLGGPTPAEIGAIRGYVIGNGYPEEAKRRIADLLDTYRRLNEVHQRAA